MSTGELLRLVRALTPRERERFFSAIHALEEERPVRQPAKTKRVKWPDLEARAKHILGNRVLPNLVLLERDEGALAKTLHTSN